MRERRAAERVAGARARDPEGSPCPSSVSRMTSAASKPRRSSTRPGATPRASPGCCIGFAPRRTSVSGARPSMRRQSASSSGLIRTSSSTGRRSSTLARAWPRQEPGARVTSGRRAEGAEPSHSRSSPWRRHLRRVPPGHRTSCLRRLRRPDGGASRAAAAAASGQRVRRVLARTRIGSLLPAKFGRAVVSSTRQAGCQRDRHPLCPPRSVAVE